MKRGLFLALGIALAGWFLYFIAPWYAIAGLGLLGGWAAGLKPVQALGWAALGAFVLWAATAGWINLQNEGLLATRVGTLLGGLSSWMMVAVSALVGALLSGMGAWLGAKMRMG